jgi:TonB-linked SusC/RagA family outer membrane protein
MKKNYLKIIYCLLKNSELKFCKAAVKNLILLAILAVGFSLDSYAIETESKLNIENRQSNQQQRTVSGKVTDVKGRSLPGVTIVVKGTTTGTVSNSEGEFTLHIPSTAKILQFSFIGFKTQEIEIGDKLIINVVMEEDVTELEEVVAVGYGYQTKASVIGSITTVSPETLVKVPTGKLSNALAGQLAGVVSVKGTGEPGSGSSFWIRGISTFGANNSPLILVDGIERSLDLVDPEDIESFSILKDATATAVYGVRGANGVVLITTKRGRVSQKPTINAKVEYGVNSPTRLPKLANAEQWIDYYNDILFDANRSIPFPNELKEKYLLGTDPDLYPNVDWMDVIFKDWSNNLRANLSISGGTSVIQYYVSGSYYRENGIFNPDKKWKYDPSINYDKYSFRSNIDVNLTRSTKIGLRLSNQFENKNKPGRSLQDLYNQVFTTTPIAIPPIYSDGTYAEPLVGGNPYYFLNNTGYSEDFLNNTQALVELTQDLSMVTKGLNFNFKFSWDAFNGSTLNRRKTPSTYYATGRDEDGNLIFHKNRDGSDYLSLGRSNTGNHSTNLESSLNYSRIFNDNHRIGGLFLFNMRQYTNDFPTDYIAAFPYRHIGFAGRATYSFQDIYFIEGNFGYNGSENFAPGKRFGFFPSVAVGYLMSNASYFKNMFPYIHILKIKGSYGEIGNDEIGGDRRFAYNSEMQNSGGYHFGTSGQKNITGIATGYPGNPNVTWETAKKSNIGLELGLFNSLEIHADIFKEKREGIYILQESVPSVVGFNVTQYVNLGEMQNKGFDSSLEYSKTFGDFSIQGRGTFTYTHNKILYDDRPTPVWPYLSNVGQVYSQQRGLIALGLFESQADIDNSPKQNFGTVTVGDIKYKDINGDGSIDANDYVPIGKSHIPEVNYGFGFSVGWKGIDVSAFFQGVGKVTRIIGGSSLRGTTYGSILVNGQLFADVADHRWTLDNPDPNARYPRLSLAYNQNNDQSSTFWQRDMSYLRLKNAELGYTLPKHTTQKLNIGTLRFYLQGLNLITFSKFKLWDPELSTNSGTIYPQMTTINFGLNIKF